ncbi:MAG: hypothetical protein ACO1QR_12520 [Chthoniobacteraceae bacterium]
MLQSAHFSHFMACMIHHATRSRRRARLVCLGMKWGVALSFAMLGGPAIAQKIPPEEMAHVREELGVNNFTAPSIGPLFQQLYALRPLPFNELWRNPPDTMPQSRAHLALATGMVIADGFLAVTVEKQSRIEPVGRALLRYSKGLGVGDKVNRRARSLMELAAREHWAEMREELVRAQAEVEAALLELKDEEIAHLIALGGWMRGLEITSEAIALSYTPERARALRQPEVVGYFVDRVSTLNPQLKRLPLFKLIAANLAEIQKITAREESAVITLQDAKRLSALAREVNKKVAE